jgi:signal transduction histidine kinase
MTTEEIVDLLASHRTIGKAPRKELVWIAEHGSLRHLKQGEVVVRQTEVVDGLYILLSGRMSLFVNRGSGLRRLMEWQGGDVTGVLPYSRLTTPPGDGIVEEPGDAIRIGRADLPEMINHCYEVTAAMVHAMTDRARRFTSTDLRDEKMISLGKLAAGFAHEVNNPASAALRDAKSLPGTLTAAEGAARTLFATGLTAAQLGHLDALWEIVKARATHQQISGLALADREDEFSDWLRDHGVTEELAGDLATTPATTGDLNNLAQALKGKQLDAALHWIAASSAARYLVADIERASTRIHTLVAAAKGFTHMDRSPDLESVEIAPGLADTVALLEGKARAKSVVITLDIQEDLPPIHGYTVEINQIWMNLIDNAVDAAPNQGHVNVTAILEGADVTVGVVDDGGGIPAEIRSSIFDPFFTTKPVGEGTGLGLDIVRRVVELHNGEVTVESRPGRTEFRVRLPIAGARK